MNTRRCCTVDTRAARSVATETWATDGDSRFLTFVRWCLNTSGWLVPSAILLLLPKCPACLAAYIVMGTGVGLSLSTARALQILLAILCIASLSYLTVKHRVVGGQVLSYKVERFLYRMANPKLKVKTQPHYVMGSCVNARPDPISSN
jgi:hypothetical protein